MSDAASARKLPTTLRARVRELEAEVERLRTRGGIAMSILTVRQTERFHARCKKLGV